jgi:hypothetical protein
MKSNLTLLFLVLIWFVGSVQSQDLATVNDLPGAKETTGTFTWNSSANRDYTAVNCDDLSEIISIKLGQASVSPGSPERVGIQFDRILRNGIPASCPSKVWPGNWDPNTQYGYHTLQFSNCSSEPVCLTINVDVDAGGSPCGVNAHALVYQSVDGTNPEPYDPNNQSANYLGDIGASETRPFSVTVNPGFFEIVFANNFSISNCDVSFSFSVPQEHTGAIKCTCRESVPLHPWTIILGVIFIVIFTVIRIRKSI